jgi:transcriptional regulator with XRE-family HTH domain
MDRQELKNPLDNVEILQQYCSMISQGLADVPPDHEQLPLGRYISLLRERAGISQVELARRGKLSPAVVSRVESGERGLTPEGLVTLLDALGTEEARTFLDYYRQGWSELPRPMFDHPDRDLLWQIAQTLMQLKTVYASPDLKHVFQRQLRSYEEELGRVAEILAARDYLVALIGSIGVGKSTMICRLTSLEVPGEYGQPAQPVLEVGGGGTTMCEVHLKRGPECGLIVEPRSVEAIRADVEDFCEYLLGPVQAPPEEADGTEEEALGISKEIVRAIRNMANLTPRREKGPDGRTLRYDPARELAKKVTDARELAVEILNRMNLLRRDRRDIWYDRTSTKPALAWLRETFSSVNNGRHQEFSIPSRIEVVIPQAILGATNLNVRIVDTKGIDQTAERADLECHFDDPHTTVVLCSLFNAAPENSVQQLLQRARDAGVRNIASKAAIVVLPRPGEALAVKDDDGTGVSSDDDGYDLKREQIEMRIQHLRLEGLQAAFFNARSDRPEILERFFLGRINALRELHRVRASDLIRTIRDVLDNYENEQVQAIVREAAKHLRTWLVTNKDIGQLAGEVHEALLSAMRGAHASTIRASTRRAGEWPNLDYGHHLSFGARKIAASAIGRKVDALRAIAQNLVENQDFAPAHNLVRQAVTQLENAMDDLLKKIQLAGRAAFAADLAADRDFWQRCIAEWGQGPGYRDRVTMHNVTWFIATEHIPQQEFVRHMIVSEWGRIIERMNELLEVDATGSTMSESTSRDVAR